MPCTTALGTASSRKIIFKEYVIFMFRLEHTLIYAMYNLPLAKQVAEKHLELFCVHVLAALYLPKWLRVSDC